MNRRIDPRKIEAVDPAVSAILRAMQPHERIALAVDAHETARELVQAQVMRMHPEWPEDQVQREVARRLTGETVGPPATRPERP